MPVTTIRGGRQITDGTIPYADIQSVTANTVLANNTASATAIQEVALSASNLLGRGTTGNIAAITVSNGIEFTGAVLQTTANLRSLAGLTYVSSSFVKMTAAGTFALDTNTYITSETSTLQDVTNRGASTTVGLSLSGGLYVSGGTGILTSGTTSITSAFRVYRSGQTPASFGNYAGSWRSAIEVWGNASDRLLFLAPPDSAHGYSIIRSANGGMQLNVGGITTDQGTLGIQIEASGVVNLAVSGATVNSNTIWHAGNFTPGNYLPLSGGTITGLVTFPSSVASRPQMPGGILGLNTGDGNVDIWGISTEYYPSHGTAANAWGIQWNGDNNQVRFIGAGTQRLVIDLDGGSTGALTWEGNNIWHAGNLTNLNQLTNGPGYITSVPALINRVQTNQINRGSFGSISISGATSGYSGIDFTDSSTTFMVRTSDQLSGLYKTDNTWLWYFDGSGILQAGTVPWTSINSKPNEIFNYDGWVSNPGIAADSMAGNKSGFTYANNAPWTGPITHFAASGYGLQLNATYSGGGNISYRTRNGDSSTWNSWYQFIHSGNIGSQSVTYANSSGGITNQKYNISDTWFRDLSDNEQVQFYGNSRTMIYRTDGNTNDHGGGAYAHIFYYGGSADGNRVLIINTDGRLYSPYHGWLDTMSITGNAATVTNGMYLSGNQEISGVKTFYTPSGQTYNAASGNIGLTVFNPAAGDAMISFHIANDYAGYFGLGGSENDLVWTGWSVGNVRHRIWHSGNDGSGSTLDADTLDTYHASNFAFSSGSNASGTGWNISILGSAGSVASSATFNNGGSGASSGTTYNGSSAVTVSWNTVGALPTPRTTTLSDNGGTYSSLDVSTTDIFVINSLTAAATFNAPTGSPYNGQKIIFRIKDNGTAKTLTFTPGSNGAFRASSDLSLPITTIAGKTLYVGFIYNSIGAGTAGTPQPRWDLLAKLDNF